MAKLKSEFRPDYVSPPGESLQEVLSSLNMSQAELARRTGRPKKTINEIIQGKTAITPETALQLELALNIPASFWNNRERQYQEALARIQEEEELENQTEWLDKVSIPVKEMCRRGWIKQRENKVDQLREVLRFFGVASVAQWNVVWARPQVSYRQSDARPINWGAVTAWLRKGEQEAHAIECAPYDAKLFQQQLASVRKQTVSPVEQVWPDVVMMCATAGVAVVLVQALPNTGISGATQWLSPDKALLQLSLRYKSDDQLWFSFFHEAAHILRHGKTKLFLESDDREGGESKEEAEANSFAADLLIPPPMIRSFVGGRRYYSKKEVLAFAARLDIAPGIVVGRLQHDGHLPHTHLNGLRRSLSWSEEGEVVSGQLDY